MTLEKLLITDKEAAEMLGIGRSTLWREVKRNTVPAPIRIGGLTRWRVEDLRNFVHQASSVVMENTGGAE